MRYINIMFVLVLASCSTPAISVEPNQPPIKAIETNVLIGAGDIGACDSEGDEATGKLLDSVDGNVFTLGDNAYPEGTAEDFQNCFEPSWGRHRARIHPAPGNHEERTDAGQPYYDYFGQSAGPPAQGWYSYRLGSWLVLMLNSNRPGPEQLSWLEAQLTTAPACTVAMWHHPVFTAGMKHPAALEMRPFFNLLYGYRVELLLQGHNHDYERWAPLNEDGEVDAVNGVRSFVVGTGGAGLSPLPAELPPGVEAARSDTHGLLKLTLHESSYEWQFLPAMGSDFTDSGSSTCH